MSEYDYAFIYAIFSPSYITQNVTKPSGIKKKKKKKKEIAHTKPAALGVGSGSVLPAVHWALDMYITLAKSKDIIWIILYKS